MDFAFCVDCFQSDELSKDHSVHTLFPTVQKTRDRSGVRLENGKVALRNSGSLRKPGEAVSAMSRNTKLARKQEDLGLGHAE